jgi:glycosyltransferase involved in cell wall biosynthesis
VTSPDLGASSDSRLSNLLCIGIPVFEEDEGLSRSISSIEALEEFKNGLVEAVIWDNDSGDDSYRVALQFAKRNPQSVRVGQNQSNIGPVGNLRQVLRNSRARFVWILGAGEELTTTSLSPLIEFLSDPLNSELAMGTVSADRALDSPTEGELGWDIESIVPEASGCFVETISLSIVLRDLALEVLDGDNPGRDDGFHVWPHLEVALRATSHPTFKVSFPPLVKVTKNPTGWWYHSSSALEIYLNQVTLLKAHTKKVDWIQARARDRCGWHFAMFAFEVKLEGAGLRLIELSKALRAGIQLAPVVVAAAIAISPKRLLRLAQKIYRAGQSLNP